VIAQPNQVVCRLKISSVEEDPSAEGRKIVVFILEQIPDSHTSNQFFTIGKELKGFTFDSKAAELEGMTVWAEVEFLGTPRIRNYQLTNIRRA
jgi:hypothetical protein